jgi:hypothetical protein
MLGLQVTLRESEALSGDDSCISRAAEDMI